MSNTTKWSIGFGFLAAELALALLGWNWINRPTTTLPSFTAMTQERAPGSAWGATTIDVDEAAELYCAGAVFLDVQSAAGYARGSIPKAEWIDTRDGITRRELARHAGPDDQIVIYCENAHCWSAYRAVKTLLDWEMPNVHYFRGGLAEWNDNRYAVRAQIQGKQCAREGWSPKARLPSL